MGAFNNWQTRGGEKQVRMEDQRDAINPLHAPAPTAKDKSNFSGF